MSVDVNPLEWGYKIDGYFYRKTTQISPAYHCLKVWNGTDNAGGQWELGVWFIPT